MRDFVHFLKSDWRRLVRTPSVPLLWLAFPLLLSLIEYAAFGHLSRSSTGLPKGTLLLVDRDRSTMSGGLAAVLQRSPMSDLFEVAKLDSVPLAEKRLIDNRGTASLVVPAGFQDSLLAGGPVDLVYTPNPREFIGPPMVDAALTSLLEIGNRFLQLSRTALRTIHGFSGEVSRESVMSVAGQFYDAGRRFEKLGRLGDLHVDVQRPAPKPGVKLGGGSKINFFAYFLPGLMLMSALLVAQGFERRYARSRVAGMTRRIAASPVRAVTLMAAESTGILLAVIVTALIILFFGAVLFRIPIHQPVLLGVTLLGYGLFAVGLLKTLFGSTRSLRTAEAVGSAVIMLSLMLGGAFAPVEVYSESMRGIAAASPVGCASSAMVDALVHDRTFGEAAPHVLGIWAWAAALLVSGLAFTRRANVRA